MEKVLVMIMVAGLVSVSQAAMIDDFQSYTEAGTISDDTGGVWTAINGDANWPDIADDGAGNQYLTNYATGGWGNQRGAYMSLGANTVADGETVILDFDMMAATDAHDMSFGLANGGSATSWYDLEAYVTLLPNGDVQLRDVGVVATDVINPGTWYHFQIVADTASDTFDFYFEGSLIYTDAPFRNGADVEDLDALKIIGYGGDTPADYVAVDNIRFGGMTISNDLPKDGKTYVSTVLTDSDNDLVFTVVDPNIVAVDVQFGYGMGGDPNLSLSQYTIASLTDGLNDGHGDVQMTVDLESLVADLEFETLYYWKVIGYEPNYAPGAPDFIPVSGLVSQFTTIGAFPIFATQPENQLVKAGGTATFTVTLVDDTGATYQWYHGDGTVVSGATSNILEITMVSAADEDDYYCVATNSAGTGTSDSASLELEKLICHWPLDGDLVDIVGGKNGTFAAGGDPNYVAGLNGGALELTGVANGWVDVGSIGISGNVPRTITGWVQATRSTQPEFGGVFGLTGSDWSTGTVFALDIYPADHYVLHTIGWTAPAGAVTSGDWGFFALTYDGSEVVAYYNGENIGSATLDLATVDNFSMGHMNSQSSAAVFAGLYDDIKVYNYARTDMEIAEDYLTVAGGYICTGTASPYDFNADCVVNLGDLVLMISDWLSCDRIPESACFE